MFVLVLPNTGKQNSLLPNTISRRSLNDKDINDDIKLMQNLKTHICKFHSNKFPFLLCKNEVYKWEKLK